MAEIALWATLLLLVLAAWTLALCYLAPIFHLQPIPLPRALLAVVLGSGLASAVFALAMWLPARASLPWYATVSAAALVAVMIGFAVARFVLRLDAKSALRAGLLLIAAAGLVAAVAAIPLKLCYPTYAIPTNGMAPTIKGRHVAGVCPLCEGETVVSFSEEQFGFGPPERRLGHLGICTKCLQVSPATAAAEAPRVGDRILVRSLATPRRWDLVVFVVPDDRRQIYVDRLVALPGESIEVKEGGIWINGVRQTPPPEIADLKWFLEDDQAFLARHAAAGNPTRLAADEYFVLGDFSPNSSDSRFFGPVPRRNLRGVVSVIYFPPRSWRSFGQQR
jgi:signal peptidase I